MEYPVFCRPFFAAVSFLLHKARKFRVLSLLWVFLFSPVFLLPVRAQQEVPKKTRKIFLQAETFYQQNRLDQAAQMVEKVLQRSPDFVKAYFLQGDILAARKHLSASIKSYRKGLSIDSVSWPSAYYVLALREYKTGDYAAALQHIRHFLQLKNNPVFPEAMHLQQAAAFALQAEKHPEKTRLVRLDSLINTTADEYVNFVNENQSEMIFTRKKFFLKNGRKTFRETFYASVWKSGFWQKPQRMLFSWDSTLNMGAMSLSVDGRTMYFTGCSWPGGYGRCDIYVNRKRGRKWLYPEHLDRNVNTSSWEAQAVVSADGKKLFFASNRPGGKGGSDLWMCYRNPDGRWGKAINLGDSINTSGNEMAPFLHPDGRTLYFSSNGRPGLGGYDLYMSRLDAAGHWSKAVNLGYPVNTKADEINLFVSLDGRRAWLSSDRDTTHTGYDIYTFPVYKKMAPRKVLFVKGVVKDSLSGKRLSAAVVLTDLSSGKTVDSLMSDPVNGTFLVVLQDSTDYAFHILKKGYLIYSENINLKQFPAETSVNRTFFLQPVKKGAVMRLENIRFAFDQAVLSASAYPELNRLVRFLKENPRLNVLIVGYTDNAGSPAYNLKLSQARAKVVYDYLVSKGIDRARLKYKGLGNQHPVASNATARGRAVNRRTEIIIR